MPRSILAMTIGLALCAPAFGQDSATMKAIRLHTYGPPSVLVYEDAPKPLPADDELLIRVKGAGVNPVDASIREGKFGRGGKLPMTAGYDVAGIVEEVGEKVTMFKKGDEIYAYLALARGGGYAQFCIVKESEAAVRPGRITFEEAAGIPLTALTAWQALVDTAHIKAGQTVLIHGGSGGVGTMAIQIAKSRGCRVVATASGKNQDVLREMKADVCVDYETQKFEDHAKEVDAVLDMVGGATRERSWGCLKKGGILVSIVGPPDQKVAAEHGVRAVGILVKPDGAELGEIAQLIDKGRIKPAPTRVMPLTDAAKAQEQAATRHTRGKIVLKPE